LLNYGKEGYDPNNSLEGATIASVTRYTTPTPETPTTVDYGSRLVLLGETKSTGIPITGTNHAGGGMAFGNDGSLFIGSGDGGLGIDYDGEALADGIISEAENVEDRVYRCQMINSLNGKIIRINAMNGDGFADIVVGASRYDEGMSNVGKIYVYMGASNGISLYPDWTYTGNIMDGNLGISVATAGDINGDGFSEIIIGSFGSGGQNPKGSAYVFSGSVRGMTNQVAQIAIQNNPQALVGQSVSTAGDINSDGYADVIAGVIWDKSNQGPGKAMLIQGSSKGLKLGGDKNVVPN